MTELLCYITSLLYVGICWCSVELQYKRKIVGESRRFGSSIDTYHHQLVIGGEDNITVVNQDGVRSKIHPPSGALFLKDVAVNKQLIVVLASHPNSVCIYSSSRPHRLVGQLHFPSSPWWLSKVAINEKSTIVTTKFLNDITDVYMYEYDGSSSSWNQTYQLHFTRRYLASVSLWKNYLAVGFIDIYQDTGHVLIYRNVGKELVHMQTIKPNKPCKGFSFSLMINNGGLVVMSRTYPRKRIFVYKLSKNGTWLADGEIVHSFAWGYGNVAIENDKIAVAGSASRSKAETSVVYKKVKDATWVIYAVLKTSDKQPPGSSRINKEVRIDGDIVVSSRTGIINTGYSGVVYVHDLSQINQNTTL